jgi:hypothetical protein
MKNLYKLNSDFNVEYTSTLLANHSVYLPERFQRFKTTGTKCGHQTPGGKFSCPPTGVDHVYPHFEHLNRTIVSPGEDILYACMLEHS